jgi:spermidine synthase
MQTGQEKQSDRPAPLHALPHVLVPLLPPESEILDIGLGCGFAASELAFHKNTKHLDIVEINPVIVEAARLFDNRGVLDAPDVSLHVMNGADWLRTVNKRYDAIVIDIEEVSVIYSSPLYTRDYYRIMAGRLKDNGVVAVWSFIITPEFTRVMYNTLRSVFPYVVMRHSPIEQATFYYAAMHPLALDFNSLPKGDESYIEQSMALRNDEVNTLENRALEKYVRMNQLFALPDNYRESFVRY